MADFIDKGLRALIKACKGPPRARVGIFAGKASRNAKAGQSGANNATIGAAHEYGSPSRNLPQRSFLRMPINDHLDQEIARTPQLAKKTFAQALKEGTLIQFLRYLGMAGERVVRLAFTNNGYGKWAKLSKARRDQKTVSNILVETTQLRESITSDVQK